MLLCRRPPTTRIKAPAPHLSPPPPPSSPPAPPQLLFLPRQEVDPSPFGDEKQKNGGKKVGVERFTAPLAHPCSRPFSPVPTPKGQGTGQGTLFFPLPFDLLLKPPLMAQAPSLLNCDCAAFLGFPPFSGVPHSKGDRCRCFFIPILSLLTFNEVSK